MTRAQTRRAAGRVGDNPAVQFLARLGFGASGLVHIAIGVIAIGVAVGAGAGEADQSGALGALASTPGGVSILWVVVVGFTALGLWLLVHAFLPISGDRKKRVIGFISDFAKGVVYLALAWTAFTFARGGSSSSASTTSSASGGLLATPGGAILLVLIGVGIVAVGIYLVVKGVRQRFTRDLTLPPGRPVRVIVVLGVAGYVAKGVALGAVGILFVIGALTGNAAKADGLDGALKGLASLPFGVIILVGVAIGLIAYGVYSFARARFAKL